MPSSLHPTPVSLWMGEVAINGGGLCKLSTQRRFQHPVTLDGRAGRLRTSHGHGPVPRSNDRGPKLLYPRTHERISQNQKAKYAIISCFVLCMVLVTRVYTKNGCDTKVLSSSLSPPSLFIAARITAADLGWIDSPKTHDHPFGLGPNRSVRNIREVYAKGQIPRPEDQMGNVRRGGGIHARSR